MGIDKFRRKVSAPSVSVTGVSSHTRPHVSSYMSAQGLTGAARWRGITSIASGGTTVTVSNATLAANSGYPIMLGLGVTTVASHRDIALSVNSIVNATSFCIVANKATVDSQEVCYVIIGG